MARRAAVQGEGVVQAIVSEVVRTHADVHERFDGRDEPGGIQAWRDAAARARLAIERFEAYVGSIDDALRTGDPGSVDAAIAFLTIDPWCFRSGYAKGRLLRRLRSCRLDDRQRDLLVDIVLIPVDRGGRLEFRDACRLGRRLGGARLRVELRRRLHGRDAGAARRALLALLELRHPRLDLGDLAVARRLVDDEAAALDKYVFGRLRIDRRLAELR